MDASHLDPRGGVCGVHQEHRVMSIHCQGLRANFVHLVFLLSIVLLQIQRPRLFQRIEDFLLSKIQFFKKYFRSYNLVTYMTEVL